MTLRTIGSPCLDCDLIKDYVVLWETSQLSYTLILAAEIYLGGQPASVLDKKAT